MQSRLYKNNMKTSLSKFCRDYELPKASVHRRCSELGIETANGLDQGAIDTLIHEFNANLSGATAEQPAEYVQATVEVGNHYIVLAAPEQPQAYSLETLRSGEAIGFEDPLAVAARFLQNAEVVKLTMKNDLKQRQERLKITQQASEAVAAKANELQLETRLYQLQADSLDTDLSRKTNDLTNSLQQLNQMGKPADG